MRCSNIFNINNLDSSTWSTENNIKGETIFPRYFLSMGHHLNNNELYIFSGMGNESGEHIVGRKYFYKLHELDLKTIEMYKLWDLTWKSPNIIPGRDLVIADSTNFYTRVYRTCIRVTLQAI